MEKKYSQNCLFRLRPCSNIYGFWENVSLCLFVVSFAVKFDDELLEEANLISKLNTKMNAWSGIEIENKREHIHIGYGQNITRQFNMNVFVCDSIIDSNWRFSLLVTISWANTDWSVTFIRNANTHFDHLDMISGYFMPSPARLILWRNFPL